MANELEVLIGQSKTARLVEAVRHMLKRGLTAQEWAAMNEAVAEEALADPGGRSVSDAGIAFLYRWEAGKGSNRLHWPGGASGVTLGPGYDLKGRSRAEAIDTLTHIGVAQRAAEIVAAGVGLSGARAKEFAIRNISAVTLTEAQEKALLRLAVQPYDDAVERLVRVPMTQNQFDALTSFAYNIGVEGFRGSTCLRRLNAGDYAGARSAMAAWNKSGGKVVQGLVNRRAAEMELFG